MVLDEMDNRVTKGQEVLYNLFQLAAYQHSTVLMFGVANSIDLVHRGGIVHGRRHRDERWRCCCCCRVVWILKIDLFVLLFV